MRPAVGAASRSFGAADSSMPGFGQGGCGVGFRKMPGAFGCPRCRCGHPRQVPGGPG